MSRNRLERSSVTGITIAEVLVSSSVLMVLLAVVFSIFFTGARAWRQVEQKTEILQSFQTFQQQLSREVERSVLGSFTVSETPPAVSFLSALDEDRIFVTDSDSGSPIWQRFVIFYFEPGSQQVFRREIPLPDGASQRSVPGPIESFNPGGGAKPLTFYLADGQPVLRDVEQISFVVPESSQRLEFEMTIRKEGFQNEPSRSLRLSSSIFVRNSR